MGSLFGALSSAGEGSSGESAGSICSGSGWGKFWSDLWSGLWDGVHGSMLCGGGFLRNDPEETSLTELGIRWEVVWSCGSAGAVAWSWGIGSLVEAGIDSPGEGHVGWFGRLSSAVRSTPALPLGCDGSLSIEKVDYVRSH